MKQISRPHIALAALAFAFPAAALADINGTTTLQSNTALNLDTGATVASGGDLLWNGSTIAPQGKARAYNIGDFGASFYDVLDVSNFSAFAVVASSAPISASALVAGDVFVVLTNGANHAKVLVTAKGAGSITLQFSTYIVPVPTGPTITAIQNNSSRIPAGLPNSGIAPSSIFVVVGTGLADPGDPVLQSSEARSGIIEDFGEQFVKMHRLPASRG